jgi:hypothetical protein
VNLKFSPDKGFIVGASLLSVLVSLLDFLGVLDSFPAIRDRIPTMTLLLPGITLGYLVIERTSRLNQITRAVGQLSEQVAALAKQIDESLEATSGRITNAMRLSDVAMYRRRTDTYARLTERIKKCKVSIDATHFTRTVPSKLTNPEAQKYYATLDDVARSGKVEVRRVVLVADEDKYEWVTEMLQNFSGAPFYVGCYASLPMNMPMVSFVILDKEEVWMTGGNRGSGSSHLELMVRNPLLAELMNDHFNALWANSMQMTSHKTRERYLARLRESIASQQASLDNKG